MWLAEYADRLSISQLLPDVNQMFGTGTSFGAECERTQMVESVVLLKSLVAVVKDEITLGLDGG